MADRHSLKAIGGVLALILLVGCEDGQNPFAGLTGPGDATPEATAVAPEGEVIERDVESPEVFSASETGLWDGRPSLGGIWVAHPDVTSPERVQITNSANGNEVIGALFRREREMPGPRIQVSSEAAAALGMLAGQPVELSVVALRRERIVIPPPEPETPEPGEAGEIEATPLEAEATAAAAIAAVAGTTPDTRPAPRPARAAPAPKPEPEPEPEPEAETAQSQPAPPPPAAPASAPDRAYIQIGIFSVEENAGNAGESLRVAGVVPTIRKQTSGDKSYWRVLVGPVTSVSERAALLNKVRDLGYADAYAVRN